MPGYRNRETRQPVSIGARLSRGRSWSDMVIRNVSPRGMMGMCAVPPERGEYVEIRSGDYVVVARVMWARGGRFGLRAQDQIELGELVAGIDGRLAATGERRRIPRPPVPRPRPTMAQRFAASQRAARAFDFMSLSLAGAVLAGLAAGAAHDALTAPLDQVSGALASP
ncbi:MAG: hypothetical protein ABIT16_08375 [Croceibacterium sp.]